MRAASGEEIILAAPIRTPIGKFGGGLAHLKAPELGAAAARATLERASVAPQQVSELIFGNARGAGVGPNPARQVAHLAGLPVEVPAFTVNQACGSGLRSIIIAAQSVALRDAEVVLAGGCESMSQVPYLVPEARWGHRLGHVRLQDGMYQDGFHCPLCGRLMGETAENLAERYKITRLEQDEYAARSQERAARAKLKGWVQEEIIPVAGIEADEHPRDGVTAESLAKLRPVFRKGGSVHAGNSSGITDAGAALLVMTAATARRLKVTAMATVRSYCTAGVDPAYMGIGPVPAVRRLLEKTGLTLDDIDLIELNEAFAAQVLACDREMHFDSMRLNVNGGAIALGHPIGATGTRIVVTLLHEMARRRARLGLATLCVSGGMGVALLLERTNP
ncbi:MAG: thiolase family protein [Acidobacteriota bacterium]